METQSNQSAPTFSDVKAAKDQAVLRARSPEARAKIAELTVSFKQSTDRSAKRCAEFVAAFDAVEPDRLTLALAMAAKGFRVFPCKPNAKEPACYWQQDATTDPAVIREWSQDMNYGVAMDAEHFVLDLDCKGDANGRDALGRLQIDYDAMPATLTVRTPSGGEHLYLTGNAPNSVRKKTLGGAIDVRGDGGYVLGPGSMIDGKPYELTENHEIAVAPDWLLKLAAKATVQPAKRDPNVELDTPGEISRVRSYLLSLVEQGDVAIAHCGGDDRTYKLFNAILDHVSEDIAYDLIAKEWNPACDPPWSDDELRTILHHAIAYRQNEIGAKASKPATEALAQTLANLPAVIEHVELTEAESPDVRRWLGYMQGTRPNEDVDLPAPEFWDDEKTIQKDPDGYVVLYQGPKGAMKTYVTLGKLIKLAVEKKVRVTYFAGEGSYGVRTTRLQAIARHLGISLDELSKFWITRKRAPDLFNSNARAAMLIALDQDRPDFVVFDTLGQAAPGQAMNSPEFGTALTAATAEIRFRYKCVVFLIHHMGKDESKGALGSTMIGADPGTVCDILKVPGHPDLRQMFVRHVREGEADRTIAYRLHTSVSLKGVSAPVPVRIPDAEFAALIKKTPKEKVDPREGKFADLGVRIRAHCRRLGASDKAHGVLQKSLINELIREDFMGPPNIRDKNVQREVDVKESEYKELLEGAAGKPSRPGKLDHLCFMAPMPGALPDAKAHRHWYCPAGEIDVLDLEDDEDSFRTMH